MLDDTGARRQESLRTSPAIEETRTFPYPLRGSIVAVYFKDHAQNATHQTLVDVQLFGGYSLLQGVPLAVPKANRANGEEWTPDLGDCVIVQFIKGRWGDPIITGWYHLPNNDIQADSTEVATGERRYHFACNATDIVVDKAGNRTTHVEGNETREVVANETVTIQTGDYTVTVTAGKCTVHVKGKTAWTSEGTVEIDGAGSGAVKGVVQGDCICAYTGKVHPHISGTVKASP